MEIVVTGIGVVAPIGIGRAAFWNALMQGASGVLPLSRPLEFLPARLAGEVRDFEPRQHIANKKSIKLMSRDMQLGVAAAQLAMDDAGLAVGQCDPDRVGVVYGADWICTPVNECVHTYANCVVDSAFEYDLWPSRGYETCYPLRFLKTLPNMAASHASIQLDARGPNNTHHQGEASGLLAIAEAVRVLERGIADVMLAGGASSLLDPYDFVHSTVVDDELCPRDGSDARAPRPFDALRDGQVRGEGAAALVLERRDHAERRGANIVCRVLGCGAGYVGRQVQDAGLGLRNAITAALRDAALQPGAIGHINAHGLGTRRDDCVEAAVLQNLLAGVPVTAPKSYFGNLAAAGGVVEAAVSALALAEGEVPPTLHYEHPDPACPVRVLREPLRRAKPAALLVNQTRLGQAAAVVLGAA